MIYKLECVDQAGWKHDLYIDWAIVNWLHLRTGYDQDHILFAQTGWEQVSS